MENDLTQHSIVGNGSSLEGRDVVGNQDSLGLTGADSLEGLLVTEVVLSCTRQ